MESVVDQDLLLELGHLGMTARIKRLSESLSQGIRELYRAERLDLEPSWHLVLLMLADRGHASVTEVAAALRLSQPAVTKMIKKMAAAGYLEVAEDDGDRRRKVLRLSRRAKAQLPVFERVWEAGRASVEELLEGNEAFLEGLELLERQLRTTGFKDRALERLHRDALEEGDKA